MLSAQFVALYKPCKPKPKPKPTVQKISLGESAAGAGVRLAR